MRHFLRGLRRLLFLAVILAILVTGGLYVYRFAFGYAYDNTIDTSQLEVNVKPDTNITNIALFGLDTREYDIGTRSDCIIILTVDNTRGKIKLTSLMRDSLVDIPGYERNKLCHAYSYGGPELAIRTLNRTFDMNITDYAAVDFGQLKVLIDLVGGVHIDVSDEERRETNKFIEEYCVEAGVPEDEIPYIKESGYQYLTGVPAMCYSRIRKGGTGDDWGRVERQGEVLQAMFDQVKTLSKPEMVNLVQKFMPYVTTSLKPTEILPLVVGAVQNGTPILQHTRIPVDGDWKYSSDGCYIKFDADRAAEQINQYIYDDIFPDAFGNESSSELEDVDVD